MNYKFNLTFQNLILFQDKGFMIRFKSHLIIVTDFLIVLIQVKLWILVHGF